jgi:hypothetical protein
MLADGGDGWPPVPSYVHVYVQARPCRTSSRVSSSAPRV